MFRILSWLTSLGLLVFFTLDLSHKQIENLLFTANNPSDFFTNNTTPAKNDQRLFITEIMYNSDGADDEWIEICNNSDNTESLSLYQVVSSTGFTYIFPEGSSLSANQCITVSLGSDGDAIFNNSNDENGNCPFIPSFGIAPNVADTNNLINTNGSISLFRSDGTTLVDIVNYNSADGANNNGQSLHLIDIDTDNSNTSTNWQEVDYGGSPGLNSLIPICLPNIVEINIEGNIGNYPDIVNGDNTPSSLDNTQFSAQLVGASQTKSYRISSQGALDVTISSIDITGDINDFIIAQLPGFTISYGSPEFLEIQFAPSSAGIKTAIIEIQNNDDDESSYTFTVRGEGICLSSSNSISPSSGPPGTVVTVTGSNLLGATADFNGIEALVNHLSENQLEVTIPAEAQSGHISITDANNCSSIFPFTIINSVIGGCEGGSPLAEIFISEVTDATYGNLSYIELFNATGGSKSLNEYSIRVYSNGNTSNYSEQSLDGFSIGSNSTFLVAFGASGVLCEDLEGTYDLNSTSLSGVNIGPGRDDFIGLYHNSIRIDEWGVFGDDNWSSTTILTGDRGFDFRRSKFASSLPEIPFNLVNWNIIDWSGSGIESCTTNDYSDLDRFDFSTGIPPRITLQPTLPDATCEKSLYISLEAEEGFLDDNSLSYQWYQLPPNNTDWTEVPDNEIYSDINSPTLQILNTFDLDGFQYFCKVMEEDDTCFITSETVRLKLRKSVWDGSLWSNDVPDLSTIAVLSKDYSTIDDSSFSCCQLVVNADVNLAVESGDYVEVEHSVFSNGQISVETSGAFVQNSSFGIIENNGTMQVNKMTSMLETGSDYTYWSSPVNSPLIGEALENANPNRRYWFNAQNYLDEFGELNNDNSNSHPPDDIDDDENVWILTSPNENMINGLGYAATHKPEEYVGNGQYLYSFIGTFNTGAINVGIFRNDLTFEDTNWNLIGNPYPCAISIQDFFEENAYAFNPDEGALEGAIYFWSQSTPPSTTNNGNESSNFSQDDYITVNASGSVAANSSGVTNNGYIPSGQSFFAAMHDEATFLNDLGDIKRAEVRFTNQMRQTANNDQFFRTDPDEDFNKLWLNLTGEGGLFCQLLISYIPGATIEFDGPIFDARRTATSSKPSLLYSLIDNNPQRFVIQGRAESDLHHNESVKLGFETVIDSSMIYSIGIAEVKGDFLETESVYLLDNYMNQLHNLKTSNYNFTSETGVFLDRFSISFSEGILNIEEGSYNNAQLNISFNQNKEAFFNISGETPMTSIQIFNLLGQLVYDLKASGFISRYQLHLIKTGPFIARVQLINGRTLIQKAVKP